VAALFAWHPLHVESVAWISERKDVLSTGFGLLALLSYTRFVEESKARSPKSKVYYALALLTFALGLMSKPMLVTLPFVMLLLDYWPLKRVTSDRWQVAGILRLALEKWPFFLLAIVSGIVTFLAQRHGEAIVSLAKVSLRYRLENAPVAVVRYLLKMIWPAHLAVLYPRPEKISPASVAVAVAILILITVVVWLGRKRRPYGLVGWLWFLGMLIPVIGLVQIGGIAMADRYTYLPSIGFIWAAALGLWDGMRRFHFQKGTAAVASGLALAACLVLTENQLRYWRDDVSLFTRVIEVTGDTGFAHLRLGIALQEKGRTADALAEYRIALGLEPGRAETHKQIADLLASSGHANEALAAYQAALQIAPDYALARCNLAGLLAKLGRSGEAMEHYEEAVRLAPDFAGAQINLGLLLAQHKRYDEAIKHYD